MLKSLTLRSKIAGTAAILMTTGALILPAAPATAYPGGSCSIKVPAKVAIKAPFQRIKATLANDCSDSGAAYASWNVIHPREGFSSIYIFDGSSSENWDFYDWSPTGKYDVEPSMSVDYDYEDLYQNYEQIDVRLGSSLAFSGSRKGKTVTLKASAKRYSTSADKYRGWKGVKVRFYTRSSNSSSWKLLKVKTASSNGKVTYKFKRSGKRYYQAQIKDSSNTWGKTSSSRRR